MPAPEALVGRRVHLRALRPSDAEALGRALRDHQVTRMLPPRVRNEGGKHFVDRALREQREGDGFAFAICPDGSNEVIGLIRLMNWSRTERRAEVGYWIRRKDWGHGYAGDALRLVCGFGFRSMRLHRIEAKVVKGNTRSQQTLEGAGFRVEGTQRRSAWVSQGWADIIEFGLLRGELRRR